MTTEPSAFVLDLITKFRNDVVELVQGSPRHTALVQSNRITYKQFKKDILGTAPAFLPYLPPKDKDGKRKDGKQKGNGSKQKHLRIDDEEPEFQPAESTETEYLYLDDVRRHIEA